MGGVYATFYGARLELAGRAEDSNWSAGWGGPYYF